MTVGYDRSMSRRGHALVLVALTLPIATAACSSGSDSSPSTSVAETIASTTDPSTTDATTSTSATTTEATTTTIDPADAFAADVEADLLETVELKNLAIQSPSDMQAVEAALAGFTGGNLEYIRAQLEEYRSKGWVARANDSVEYMLTIEQRAQPNGGQPDSAVVQVCEIDPWIIVEPGAGPGGSDAIVNDDVYAYRSLFVLELVDGRWLIRGSDPIGEWTGVTECPAM